MTGFAHAFTLNNNSSSKPNTPIIEMASWTNHSLCNVDGLEEVFDNGNFSVTNGGMDHYVFEFENANHVPYYTETTDCTLAPDQTITLERLEVDSNNSYYTNDIVDNLETFPIQLEEGMWSGIHANGMLLESNKESHVKMTLFTGGVGVAGQQVLVAVNASATQEYPVSTNIPYNQIAIPGLGRNLGSDGWAYGAVASGTPVDVTPTVKNVLMYTFSWPTATAHAPISTTVHTALTDTNRARTNLGVGEQVSLSFDPPFNNMPGPFALDWSTTAGGVDATGNFVAPSNAASATVTATVHGDGTKVDFPTFNVVEPSSPTAKIKSTHSTPAIPSGFSGAFMELDVTLQPTDVSFYRVQVYEVSNDVINATGYWTNSYSPPKHTSANQWHSVNENNLIDKSGNFDTCEDLFVYPSQSPPSPQYAPGGEFTWPIPARWAIDINHTNSLSWSPQHFKLDSDGTLTIDKFGVSVERDTTNNINPDIP
jgi:hypothetical protein